MSRQKLILFLVRSMEIFLAAILAFYFRQLIDWFLAPLPLGQWVTLVRWLFLILFIGAVIRIHPIMINFLKQKNIVPQDFTW